MSLILVWMQPRPDTSTFEDTKALSCCHSWVSLVLLDKSPNAVMCLRKRGGREGRTLTVFQSLPVLFLSSSFVVVVVIIFSNKNCFVDGLHLSLLSL